MNLEPRNGQDAYVRKPLTSSLSTFMSRVYAWMMAGILVTGFISFYIGSNPELVAKIFSNRIFFWAVIIAQFGAVIYLTAAINRISATAAAITFLAYSALTGLTLSIIFVAYTQQSIVMAFVTTAGAFGGLSLIGFVTKRDLGPVGSFCAMGLIGIIIISLLSLFIPSFRTNSAQMVISGLGVLIFAGLTAYDTQKIKNMPQVSGAPLDKLAVFGALQLYLDFLNLFLFILRLMGNARK